MAKSIAKISGVALRPGVSRNGRLYTADLIKSAVKRAQARLADDDADEINILTHHAAGDDSTQIVGRITSMALADDGSATYEADIAGNEHGQNILKLIDTRDGKPFLKGVSIRGAWLGNVRREQLAGRTVETADDLEIDGVDLTKKPGVPGARVNTVSPTGEATESDNRHWIFESVEDVHVIVEDADMESDDDMQSGHTFRNGICQECDEAASGGTPYGDVAYADPGYQSDKVKRYPIDTKAHAKAAWSYINQKSNSAKYTANQLKRISERISKTLRKFGVEINAKEGWIMEPARVVDECYGDIPPAGPRGRVNLSLSNGMFTVDISSYQVDPADLDVIGRAAMSAACAAVLAMDPDMDGDMDIPGAPGEDTDHDMETAPVGDPVETTEPSQTPEPEPASGDTHETEAPVADTIPAPAAGDAPAAVESTPEAPAEVAETAAPAAAPSAVEAKLDALIGAIGGLVEKLAPAAAPANESVTEAPAEPVVEETEEQRIDRLVQEKLTAAVQKHVEDNGVSRKGFVVSENAPEGAVAAPSAGLKFPDYPPTWPQKPLHEFTSEEQKEHWHPQLEAAIVSTRLRHAG